MNSVDNADNRNVNNKFNVTDDNSTSNIDDNVNNSIIKP